MFDIIPAKKLKGTVSSVLVAKGKDFVSREVESLPLTYDGVTGDFHAGALRKSGGREPWYKRGTEMRNERQVSILSVEELEAIRQNLGIAEMHPGWIGANLVLEGIPNMSFLPARTLLFFESGATIRIDGYNGPCRLSGGMIARYSGAEAPEIDGEKAWDRSDVALAFKDAARMKRGLVGWVEREGEVRAGESFTARVWEQWVYE